MGRTIEGPAALSELWKDDVFSDFSDLNVLPLIYNEKKQICNILVFDHERAQKNTARIVYEEEGKGRKHPVYRFYDSSNNYICEVRYGGGTANALQRGLWTNTKTGRNYFDSITEGWITYAHNSVLVKLFSHALISTEKGHTRALVELKKDIEEQKQMSALRGER